MTCMQIHQAISARLDGEDPGLDDATVYAHLASCAECRAAIDAQTSAHRALANPRTRGKHGHAPEPGNWRVAK